MMTDSWERIQITRKRRDDERSSELMQELCLVQRVSESRTTASQIVIAEPGASKFQAWQGVKAYLMTGAWC